MITRCCLHLALLLICIYSQCMAARDQITSSSVVSSRSISVLPSDVQKRAKAQQIVEDFLKIDPEMTKLWKTTATDALYALPEDTYDYFVACVPRLFTNDMDGYMRSSVMSSFARIPVTFWDEASQNIPAFFEQSLSSDKKVKRSTAFYNTMIVSAFSKVHPDRWVSIIAYAQQAFALMNAKDYKHEIIDRLALVPIDKREIVLGGAIQFIDGLAEFERMRVLSGFCRDSALRNVEAFKVFIGKVLDMMREVDATNRGATIDNLGRFHISYRGGLIGFIGKNRLYNPSILEWLVTKKPDQWPDALKDYRILRR